MIVIQAPYRFLFADGPVVAMHGSPLWVCVIWLTGLWGDNRQHETHPTDPLHHRLTGRLDTGYIEAYHGELDLERWALTPVAQLDHYKGLYFATFDPQAPPLHGYLGAMTWYLDTFFDRPEGGIEVIGGMHKWVMPCNWKFPAENFGGDGYHTSWSHLSAIRTGFGGDFRVRTDPRGTMLSPGNGHCIIAVAPDMVADPPAPEVLAYEAQIQPEVERRLGPRLERVKPVVGTIFPNFSMLRPTSRTFRVWHPRGPDKTEVWAWVYVDKAAPPEVKEAIRLAGVHVFGPSGAEDLSREDELAIFDETKETLVQRITRLETGMVWAAFMDATNWTDLAPSGNGARFASQ